MVYHRFVRPPWGDCFADFFRYHSLGRAQTSRLDDRSVGKILTSIGVWLLVLTKIKVGSSGLNRGVQAYTHGFPNRRKRNASYLQVNLLCQSFVVRVGSIYVDYPVGLGSISA